MKSLFNWRVLSFTRSRSKDSRMLNLVERRRFGFLSIKT